ncbi:MAG: YraN family protein [Proteobacteria bacterium]|nr:YraN family protein [Pseudomonadota bacterium]
MSTARAQLGQRAESLACEFLQARGWQVLDRNYRRRLGELDIVASDGKVLLIAEVRCRSGERYGGAAASVNRRKQQHLIRAAAQLLQRQPPLARLPARFDVIVVKDAFGEQPAIQWIKHAFQA